MTAIRSTATKALCPLVAATFLLTACQSDATAPAPEQEGALEPAFEYQTAPAPGPTAVDGSGIARLGVSTEARVEGESLRAQGDAVPVRDQYIVVFKEDAQDVAGLTQELTRAHRAALRHSYTQTLKGFAAKLSAASATALARDPRVLFVEQDQIGRADVVQNLPTGQPWGLDRIDQRFGLSKSYIYGHTGAGVNAYILDSGLDSDHPDFGGRARNVATVYNDNGEDCYGHGTHVAGTVGGTKHGVAKRVLLLGVKILNCNGSGSTSDAIAAVEWVRNNHRSPAVANMSLKFARSAALNQAVNRLAAAGVFIAVSAGNANANACNQSPAAATSAFTTAASGSSISADAKASFSNWGSCVDGYAPGYAIQSAKLGGGGTSQSGTSMAAPHVAGVAALIKQAYGNRTSASITTTIKTWATPNVIEGNPAGTANKLLFKDTL